MHAGLAVKIDSTSLFVVIMPLGVEQVTVTHEEEIRNIIHHYRIQKEELLTSGERECEMELERSKYTEELAINMSFK